MNTFNLFSNSNNCFLFLFFRKTTTMTRRGAGARGEKLVVLIRFKKKTYSVNDAFFLAFLHFLFGLSNVVQSVLCIVYHFYKPVPNSKL